MWLLALWPVELFISLGCLCESAEHRTGINRSNGTIRPLGLWRTLEEPTFPITRPTSAIQICRALVSPFIVGSIFCGWIPRPPSGSLALPITARGEETKLVTRECYRRPLQWRCSTSGELWHTSLFIRPRRGLLAFGQNRKPPGGKRRTKCQPQSSSISFYSNFSIGL